MRNPQIPLASMVKMVLTSLYPRTGVLRAVLSAGLVGLGPAPGFPGAGFALKDGGKNGSAGHHFCRHLHAGLDGAAASSVHAI